MFDIGFWELAMIFVIALLVIGPEHLPTVARTAGSWMGSLNRFIRRIKEDINTEIKTDELQKMLHLQEDISRELRDVVAPVQQDLQQTKNHFEKLSDKPDSPDANLSETPRVSASSPDTKQSNSS